MIDHPLSQGADPDWAHAWGQDHFGVFAEVEVKGVTFRFRWIPPGSFQMGSPPNEEGRFTNEEQHLVVLRRGYWLGETPVTQAQWVVLMGQNPSRFQTSGQHPVEKVSWQQALDCCAALQAVSPGPGLRLPTEAEWEYACRALSTGPTSAPERPLGNIAWFAENAGGTSHPVGEKPANPWGLYDMLGNVWEWCQDAYATYETRTQYDPSQPTGVNRVFRGGSCYESAGGTRASFRPHTHPNDRGNDLGFRLARGPALQTGAEPGEPDKHP